MQIAVIILAILIVATLATLLAARYARLRGARVITCPDNHQYAGVEVDAAHATLTSIFHGKTHLQLQSCTRWPEKEGCGQECVAEIESATNHCLVRAVLADWYLGRKCRFCQHAFGQVNWHDHKPALFDADRGRSVEWTAIAPEKVYDAMSRFEPVCWNCHVAETFRQDHGDLVTDRRYPRSGAI